MLGIFLLVVLGTFPVALPFLVVQDPTTLLLDTHATSANT